MKRAIAIVVWTVGSAVACGQKGPLHLPGQPMKNAPWPPPAQPQAAPDTAPHAAGASTADDQKK